MTQSKSVSPHFHRDIGINTKDCLNIAQGLEILLANTYALYIKTHGFHWNVTGPLFHTLHALFETQYLELAEAVDEIAERLRALGHIAPASLSAFTRLSQVNDAQEPLTARERIAELANDHATVVRHARHVLQELQTGNDEVTADLLVERMRTHEKTHWMLCSLLEEAQ